MSDCNIFPKTNKKLIWLSRSGPAFEFPTEPAGQVCALAFVQALFGAAWAAEFAGQGGNVALLAGLIRAEARRRQRMSTDGKRVNGSTDGKRING